MRNTLSILFLFFFFSGFAQERKPLQNVVLENKEGQQFNLDDFKGKVLYIDVWASWCLPCRWEFPKMQKLKEVYKDEAVEFISISIDHKRDKWEKYVERKEVEKHQYIGIQPSLDTWQETYEIWAIPHFILVDKKGNVYLNNSPRPSSFEIDGLIKALLDE